MKTEFEAAAEALEQLPYHDGEPRSGYLVEHESSVVVINVERYA